MDCGYCILFLYIRTGIINTHKLFYLHEKINGTALFLSLCISATFAQDIYIHNSRKGEIRTNGDIYINYNKVGYIEDDGDVYKGYNKVGYIENDGDIYVGYNKAGYVENDGDVYIGYNKAGYIENDGDIYMGYNRVGTAPASVKREWIAAIVFFFFTSELGL